jgi:hypothetical protein
VSNSEKGFRSYAISVKAFDGRRVALLDEDWLHIRFRHPEVGPGTELLSTALAQPDEAYRNGRGGVHALKRINEQHFLVVIYEPRNNEGLVRTAYLPALRGRIGGIDNYSP